MTSRLTPPSRRVPTYCELCRMVGEKVETTGVLTEVLFQYGDSLPPPETHWHFDKLKPITYQCPKGHARTELTEVECWCGYGSGKEAEHGTD